ncbi:leucyl aminopeptidase family protein [Devosia sp. MC532]|uniref:leucyl aminopeptidase family protein n=1 Tax=Devosia sp. MC532 TaxID=2799788 RepID=UPI0018F4CEF8|nr:leucyl aminopeptidase family protein [Devosia sp. MC532]MBJ7579239.1 leucyl aminopeptidase family protein [Devosia sp. MC532]
MAKTSATPVIAIVDGALDDAALTDVQRKWAQAHGFSGQTGKLLAVPDAHGDITAWLLGMGPSESLNPFTLGLAGSNLPEGTYALEGQYGDATQAATAFKLGAYRFDRYRDAKPSPQLEMPEGADADEVDFLSQGAFLARDLINTPANDLGPDALDQAIRDFARRNGMKVSAIVGDDLLGANLPLIHAVGRANAQAPRLLDLSWGDESHPKVTLVGKGVTFDTGGLDIKPAAGMLMMKKDMGGAANILGLAHAVVNAELPVRLRVLIPIVENSIAGNSFRPGDVIRSRAGLTVEIGNTDAEGRLILADALALADEEAPDLLVDMATLTGAARIALGPELPATYSSDPSLAYAMANLGPKVEDPVWPLPLWANYGSQLNSKIADMNNTGAGGFGGSIIAALFLQRFVKNAGAWVHMDIFAWAPELRPARPVGATDQGIRVLYALLKQRYGA